MLSGEPATQRQLVEATNLDASDGPRVTYAPGRDATLEGERGAAHAAVYAIVVIQAHEQEKAAVSYDEDVEGR